MSLTAKQEQQRRLAQGEIRNISIVLDLVNRMNRLSGKIKDGTYINSLNGSTGSQKTTGGSLKKFGFITSNSSQKSIDNGKTLNGTNKKTSYINSSGGKSSNKKNTLSDLKVLSYIASNSSKAITDTKTTIGKNKVINSVFTREMAAKSVVTCSKGKKIRDYLCKEYGTKTEDISIEYGKDGKYFEDRQKVSKDLFNDVNEEEFTTGFAYSQGGETQLYAMKRWTNGENVKLPTVLVHADTIVKQASTKDGETFSPLSNLENQAKDSNNKDDLKNKASSFTNAVVSVKRDQILIHSTSGDYNFGTLAKYVKEDLKQLSAQETGNYEKYGFETREGVEVINIYQNNDLCTFTDGIETPKGKKINVVCDDVYVIEYSDKTSSNFEVVGLNTDHGGILSDKSAEIMLTWLEKEGIKFNINN